jgi:hypothetical protein
MAPSFRRGPVSLERGPFKRSEEVSRRCSAIFRDVGKCRLTGVLEKYMKARVAGRVRFEADRFGRRPEHGM